MGCLPVILGKNVALLYDVCTYANELNLFVAILSLDQENAFDRFDWSSLLSMGFSSSLISWLNVCMRIFRSCIRVDGYVSPSLKPSRGAGCAVRLFLSPLLYVLTMEVLAVNRVFKIQLSERQPERQKTIGFISKTTTFHVHYACVYISLPLFARLPLENA